MLTITDKHGHTYDVVKTPTGPPGAVCFAVRDGTREVGFAVLSPCGGHIDDVQVFQLADRRKGICTALYKLIERDLPRPLAPGGYAHSYEMKQFWKKRRGSPC